MSDQNWSSQKLPGAGSAPGHPSDVAAMKMHAWMARLIDALRQPAYLRGMEALAPSRAHNSPNEMLAPSLAVNHKSSWEQQRNSISFLQKKR